MSDFSPTPDALFQLAGVGVVQTDLTTGRFVRTNGAFCDMVGYSEAELLELTYLELTHPDDRGRDAEHFAALQQGEQQTGTSLTRVVHKDGNVVWLELHVTLIKTGDGITNITVAHDVTQRQRAEEAVRGSEVRYRTLFNSIDEGFCVVEVLFNDGEAYDYRFLEANAAFEKQTGLVGVVGRSMRDLVPDHEAYWFNIYGDVALTGEAVRFEHNAEALGHFYDGYAFRVGAPEERKVAVLFNDITENKRAEAALRESEARFRAFVTASSDAVYRMSADWTEMHSLVGKAFIADTDDPSSSWLETYIHPDDQPHVFGVISEAIGTKSLFELEHRVVRVDGSLGWTHSRALPLLDAAGDLSGWLGTARDITDRKRAEEALHDLNHALEQRVEERTEALSRSEQRFAQAFYSNPIPACMTTFGKETFIEVNDAFLALTGYERDEVVAKTAFELGMWSSPDDRRKLDEAQRDERGFHNLELQLRHKEGNTYDVLLSAAVIRLDGHEGYLKMFYDITERKESEELLLEAVQEVMRDTSWFSRKLLERLANIRSGRPRLEVTELSRRERQVLERLAKGLNNDAIATELQIRPQTVRNYISNVYDKLGVHTRSEAIVWARERGII